LSFAIVDEAAVRRRGSRLPTIDPLRANDELIERLDRESEEETLGIAAEVKRRRRRRAPVHRSQGLRMARDRQRARGEKA
jgi:hypothetical protein